LQEALRFAEGIGGVGDFEARVFAGLAVKGQLEVFERLAGNVGERRAALSGHGMRQFQAGSFEVALHADFHFALRREAFWVDDGGADFVGGCARFGNGIDVVLAGSVAALATDAVGEGQQVDRFGAWFFVSFGDFGVGVVAEEALVVDGAFGAGIIGAVEAGEHVPGAAVFGVPAEGELLEAAARIEVEISAAVVAGAEDVVGGFLFDVGFAAVVIELPAALVGFAIALDHGEVAVRGGVIEGLAGEGIGGVVGGDFGEGAAHAGFGEIGGDFGVAGGAEGGVCVGVGGFGGCWVERLLREESGGRQGGEQGCGTGFGGGGDPSHRLELSHVGRELEATLIGVEKRNVNLRLPVGLLRTFRVMAAKQGLSTSSLATSAISKMILDEADYDARAKRMIDRMKNAPGRGIGAKITWTREEVWDRG